ncbi:MAG: DUF4337 family protein [Acetobacteraceae bacterium]|jgi:hypothetical protein
MVDPVETAQQQLEKAHESHDESDHWARWMAVAVSCLAASLALVDLGAKSSQTAYLTHNITASDTWNAYQGKNLRANLWNTQATMLLSLPNAADPAVQERIKTAQSEAERMHDEPATGDGMKQLKAKAENQERDRDLAFHAYHGFEYTSSALEISIVLASVSVVTRVHALGLVAAGIGLLAAGYGLAVFAHFV